MDVKQGLISIIIPVFNVKDYLDRCMESIVQQTYEYIEVLVIDDGSDDGSEEICDKWAKRDSRIRVFHKKNGGASSARNLGLRNAKGEFIGFVDSDDYIDLDMYGSLIAAMDKDVDIVSCGTILEYPGRMKINNQVLYLPPTKKKKEKYTRISAMEELLLSNAFSFSPCDKLFRRESLENVKFPVGRSSEDLPVIFNTFVNSSNIVNIGQVKYHYMSRPDSNSRQSFFYRRVDYAVFAGSICKEVTLHYPQLKSQAEVLYIRCLENIIGRIKICGNRKEFLNLEIRLKKAFIKMFIKIIFNRYISMQEKQGLIKNVCTGRQ